MLLGFAGTLLLTILAFAFYSKDLPDPNKIIDRDIAQSTKIYDRTGEHLLYEIHGAERRTLIELSQIPQYAIDATIAIEDKNFYKHKGLSLPHIAKAIVLEVLQKIRLYNGTVPGGSTLTQQFIKNAVLTTEKSYARKIKEFVLAYRIEQKFSKEEILKLYFNEIPYGSTAYGIETASHIYFDKSAKDLTLAEAAVLAALPQAPSYYSPYGSHKEELLGRQRYILKLMAEQSYITEEEAADAQTQEIVFKKRREDIAAPHFVFMVKELLSERYGERLVEQGGLKIITTIDFEKQRAAEEAVAAQETKNAEQYNAHNASLVSIDVTTGEIVALVGSKDYFNDDINGQVNIATSSRQPGSSLKPLIYAEAFNRGYRPDTIVYDLNTSFAASGAPYRPQNYDGKERGPITLRSALQGSLNIPAVKVLYLVGARNAVERAREFGYNTLTDPDRYGLSLVLGGAEVRLLEHVNAYAAFAREGIFKQSVAILKVEDGSGAVLEEHKNSEERRVLPRDVARTLTNVLSDNGARAFIFGGSNHLTLSGRPAAAKTGTTNNYHDAWTLGYTPQFATGVWVGNADNTAMKRGADGSVIAAPIWQNYMNKIHQGTPVESFNAPTPLQPCDKPMLCGNTGVTTVKINADTGKLASPYTPLSKIKEITFQEAHSILYYVKREDPTGSPPQNPESDPQYRLWEEPVQKWAELEGITNQTPPTEVDDLYRPEDQPSISWTVPQNNTIIRDQTTSFAVSANAPKGVAKVLYFLNNVPVGESNNFPYSLLFQPSPVTPNGTYTLRAVVQDTIGNEQIAALTITLDVDRSSSDWMVTWEVPENNARYAPLEVPADLQIRVQNSPRVQKIDFYYMVNGTTSFIGVSEPQADGIIKQNWTPPSLPGNYTLIILITDSAGNVYTLPHLSFTIEAA